MLSTYARRASNVSGQPGANRRMRTASGMAARAPNASRRRAMPRQKRAVLMAIGLISPNLRQGPAGHRTETDRERRRLNWQNWWGVADCLIRVGQPRDRSVHQRACQSAREAILFNRRSSNVDLARSGILGGLPRVVPGGRRRNGCHVGAHRSRARQCRRTFKCRQNMGSTALSRARRTPGCNEVKPCSVVEQIERSEFFPDRSRLAPDARTALRRSAHRRWIVLVQIDG